MIITRQSPFSGKVNSLDIDITQAQIALYEAGELIQNAFPNISPDEREFIKTGITKEEWEETFGE
jgi:hypothetical protein